MSSDDLMRKVLDVITGHDLDDIIEVMMCSLGVAICGELEDPEDRLEKIMDVQSYLLGKALLDERS